MALVRITKRCRTLTATQALGSLAKDHFHSARPEEVLKTDVINDVPRRTAILCFHSVLNGFSQEKPADKTDTCYKGYGVRFDALPSR